MAIDPSIPLQAVPKQQTNALTLPDLMRMEAQHTQNVLAQQKIDDQNALMEVAKDPYNRNPETGRINTRGINAISMRNPMLAAQIEQHQYQAEQAKHDAARAQIAEKLEKGKYSATQAKALRDYGVGILSAHAAALPVYGTETEAYLDSKVIPGLHDRLAKSGLLPPEEMETVPKKFGGSREPWKIGNEALKTHEDVMNERTLAAHSMSSMAKDLALIKSLPEGPEKQMAIESFRNKGVPTQIKIANAEDAKGDPRFNWEDWIIPSRNQLLRRHTETNKWQMFTQGKGYEDFPDLPANGIPVGAVPMKAYQAGVTEFQKNPALAARTEQTEAIKTTAALDRYKQMTPHVVERTAMINMLPKMPSNFMPVDPADPLKGIVSMPGGPADFQVIGDFTKTGKDFMDSVRPDQQPMVKAYAAGHIDPRGWSNRGYQGGKAARQSWGQAALAADPDFTENRFPTRQAYTRGPIATNLQSINTLVSHLGTLQEALEMMKNGNIPAANRLFNTVGAFFGLPFQPNAELAAIAVGSEMMRAFRGAGAGSQKETAEWTAAWDTAKNPETQALMLKTAVKLLGGRLTQVNEMYKAGGNFKNDFEAILSPEARETLVRLGADKRYTEMGFPEDQKSAEAKAGRTAPKEDGTDARPYKLHSMSEAEVLPPGAVFLPPGETKIENRRRVPFDRDEKRKKKDIEDEERWLREQEKK